MTLNDKILAYGIGIALITVLVMSFFNVYSVLIASGNPAFIQHPFAAYALSALAPISSFAPKLMMRAFETKRAKKRYALFIYVLTCMSVLVWCILYGMHYSASTGELDIDLDSEEDSTGHYLVFTQLFTEIVLGTALFIGLDSILDQYQPQRYRPNPRWYQFHKELEAAQKQLHVQQTLLGKQKAQRAKLNAKRQRMIKEAVVIFKKAKAHTEGAFNF